MSTSASPPAPLPCVATESLWGLALEATLIVLLALTLNLAGNGRTSLWDRDEPRFAGTVREMRASGDFLRPSFNAEPRYHKPILIYWLMCAGTAVAGDSAFGARLVSALSGAATCLLVWWIGRRIFDRKTGRLAALAFATAPIVFVESKLATTDAFLMLCIGACQMALWELSRRPSRTMVGVFWAGLALAVLTKGPVAPAFLAMAGLISWWWGGPTACWKRLEWKWGLVILTLIAAPWFIAIGIATHGDFYRFAVGKQVIERVTTPLETHGGFPGYYLVATLMLFYPWSAFLAPGVVGAWRKRRVRPELAFLLGWIVGPMIVLELLRTKLVHYYLPAYPACALLVAWLIGAVAESEVNLRRWPLGRLALGILTGLGIALTVGLLAGVLVIPAWSLKGPCLALAVVVGAGTLFGLERFQAGATTRATTGLIASWAVALLVLAWWLLPAIDPYRLSPKVARHLADLAANEHAEPLLSEYKPPSVIYYYGHPIAEIANREDLIQRVRRDGPAVLALNRDELKILESDPRIVLEKHEEVRGVDVEHAKDLTLRMAVIRPGRSELATVQKSHVK